MSIEQRNKIIVIIQKEFNVGYARAAQMFKVYYNTPMFVVCKV